MSQKKKEPPKKLNLRGYTINDVSQPSDDVLILDLVNDKFAIGIKITTGCHGIADDPYLIIEKVIRKEVVQKVTESEPVVLI